VRLQRPELGLRARVTLAFAGGGAGAVGRPCRGSATGWCGTTSSIRRRTAGPPGGVRERRRDPRRPEHPDGQPSPRILASLQDPRRQPDPRVPRRQLVSRPRVGIGRDSLPATFPGGGQRRPSRPARPTAWPASTRLAVGLPIPAVKAAYFEVLQPRPARPGRCASSVSPCWGPAWPPRWPGAAVGRWGQHPAAPPRWPTWPRRRRRWPAGGSRPASPTTTTLTWPPLTSVVQTPWPTPLQGPDRGATPGSPPDVSHELRSPLTTLATTVGVLASRRDELPERSRAALDLLSGPTWSASSVWWRTSWRSPATTPGVGRPPISMTCASPSSSNPGGGLRRRPAGGARAGGPCPTGWPIQADKRRMERVIANLVENAAPLRAAGRPG